MKTYYYIASSGVLGVKTNIKSFGWSYGHNVPEGTKEQYDCCAVRLQVDLKEFSDDAEHEMMGKYHYFSGTPGADKLYYTRNYAGKGRMRIRAEGFLTDEPKITVNRAYYKLVTHRIMNLHSIGYIMTDLATLLLLKKGYAPIHCSAFKKEGSTLAVFAPPDTGKTLSSMTACIDHGAEFIAEDLAITDGRMIHSVPWTSSFRYYSNFNNKKSSKLSYGLSRLVPMMEHFNPKSSKQITEYVDKQFLLSKNAVTHIAVLERGEEHVAKINDVESLQKIMNLNRYIFNYLRSPLLTAYEFFNPELEIDQALANEREILTKLIRNSEKVFSVKKINATHYTKELLDQIGSPIADAASKKLERERERFSDDSKNTARHDHRPKPEISARPVE
ncbi:hypothetical protein [Planococcus sp. ISL-109]|uniref:hypothetical protein n=1 Tax=Planococcus sp. ISL-109 TaxID=2819166 RepID=UPI001BEBC804|nr:hypothetical protein [Planococcus sp. ISL-109]MBT2581542.1 hypothetical protein [Planococcus sp. ISL-109]